MYDNFNDFEENVIDYSNYDGFADCTNCPYLIRQFPQQPPPPTGQPPFGGMGSSHQRPPTGPPPSITPYKSQAQVSPHAVSPGSIRPCTFRFVYIWLENGRSFWAWLTRVDRRSASGFRWNGRRWIYFGIDLREIESFECY